MDISFVLEGITKNLDLLREVDERLKALKEERARGVSNSSEFSSTLTTLTAIKSLISAHLTDLRAEHYLEYKDIARRTPIVSRKKPKEIPIEEVLELVSIKIEGTPRTPVIDVKLRNKTSKTLEGEVRFIVWNAQAWEKDKSFKIDPYGEWSTRYGIRTTATDKIGWEYIIYVEKPTEVTGNYRDTGELKKE